MSDNEVDLRKQPFKKWHMESPAIGLAHYKPLAHEIWTISILDSRFPSNFSDIVTIFFQKIDDLRETGSKKARRLQSRTKRQFAVALHVRSFEYTGRPVIQYSFASKRGFRHGL